VQAIGKVERAPQSLVSGGPSLEAAVIGHRKMFVDSKAGWCESKVLAREFLPIGQLISGPVIINEMSATTLVFPGQTATVDPLGNIIVEVNQ
jgi:N-methylhydantoinase A